MSSKFLNYCNYDIYVYCSSNRSLLRYLSDFSIKKYIYPSENDLQNFLIFKETLEKKEKERGFEETKKEQKNSPIFKNEAKIDFIVAAFSEYKIDYSHEIIKMLMNSNDSEINEAIKKLNGIHIPEKLKVRNCSKYLFFELTQEYFESKTFEEDFLEAKKLNKYIFFILYENEQLQLEAFTDEKIFKIIINRAHEIIQFDESLKSIIKYEDDFYIFGEFVDFLIGRDSDEDTNKYAYLSYSKVDEKKVNMIINETDKLQKLSLSEVMTQNRIELADTFIFFLTKDFMKTEHFKKDFKAAKAGKKIVLFVIIGNLDEITFQKFELNKFSVSDLMKISKNEIDKLRTFILRALEIERVYYGKNLKFCEDLTLLKIKKLKLKLNTDFNRVFIISDKEILVGNETKGRLKLVDLGTFDIIKEIEVDFQMLFCWIEHSKKILIINSCFYNNADACCALYQNNGKFLRNIKIPLSEGAIESIAYNLKNANTYILIDDWEERTLKILVFDSNYKVKETHKVDSCNSIRTFNDLLFLSYENSANFNLYEKNMEFITSVTMPTEIKEVIIDPNEELFIFLKMESLVGIYNTKNFSVLSFIKNPLNLHAVNEKMMLFSDYKNNFYFYKVKLKKSEEMLDRRYICKMNNFHYYENPHVLPCGNTTCLNCIYRNYNLHKNVLKCSFCSKEHILPIKLQADTKRANLMTKYNDQLIQEMMEYGNNILEKDKGIFESLENKFSYIEHLIDIRMESLKIELDKFEENLMHEIDFFENKNINKTDSKMKKPKYFWIKKPLKRIRTDTIGIMYNEYTLDFMNCEDEEDYDSEAEDKDEDENFLFFYK